MATPQHDACTAEGQVKEVLLNGDTENYSGEQGYTMHTITRDHSKGITVQLNHPYIINCVRMLLWDRDNRRVRELQPGILPIGIYRGSSAGPCTCAQATALSISKEVPSLQFCYVVACLLLEENTST